MVRERNLVFRDAREKQFELCGFYDSADFSRFPRAFEGALNTDANRVLRHSTGCRVRFLTDSPHIAVAARLFGAGLPYMSRLATHGFDLYADGAFFAPIIPDEASLCDYEKIVFFPDRCMREIELYFPLFSEVKSLSVGLSRDAVLTRGNGFSDSQPIVLYGSSITQGICASRPGNAYAAMLARILGCDIKNLALAGGARGERCIAEFAASLPMRAFIMDYDNNARTAEELSATHYDFYRIVRERNPDLKIALITMPPCALFSDSDAEKRREIIRGTYNRGLREGDCRLAFIDGYDFYKGDGTCTVDRIHPNDIGMLRIAEKIASVLKKTPI